MNLKRRDLLPLLGAGMLAGVARIEFGKAPSSLPAHPRVRALRRGWQEEDLVSEFASCGLDATGKRVLIVTQLESDPKVTSAVYRAIQRAGASQIRIGAGPNLERDAWAAAESAGYCKALDHFDEVFVDLNRDDVSPVEGFEGGTAYVSNSALRADAVLSLANKNPGVSLNLSSVLPGAVYGWPKRKHSTAEVAKLFPRAFGVVCLDGGLVLGETLGATDSAAASGLA
jgi:hypothetical protein